MKFKVVNAVVKKNSMASAIKDLLALIFGALNGNICQISV